MTRSWVATRALTGQYKVLTQVRFMGDGPKPIKVDIGTREIVGFGSNGENNYTDDVMYPFPAIRFQEDSTGGIAVKNEKSL